jgi:hypothetical protein
VLDTAKLGVLGASIAAGLVGSLILRRAAALPAVLPAGAAERAVAEAQA